MPMNFSIKSSNQIVKAHCAPRIILGYSSVLLSGFATASHDSRPAFPSASTSPCESTNGVSMNGNERGRYAELELAADKVELGLLLRCHHHQRRCAVP
jgi:hypothetical protein